MCRNMIMRAISYVNVEVLWILEILLYEYSTWYRYRYDTWYSTVRYLYNIWISYAQDLKITRCSPTCSLMNDSTALQERAGLRKFSELPHPFGCATIAISMIGPSRCRRNRPLAWTCESLLSRILCACCSHRACKTHRFHTWTFDVTHEDVVVVNLWV